MKKALGIGLLLILVTVGLVACTALRNVAPTAMFTATPTAGTSPLVVAFNASGSFDSNGTIATWAWDFGDTQNATGESVEHTFISGIDYVFTVILTATDNQGATDTYAANITVTGNPEVGNHTPIANDDYAFTAKGDAVRIDVTDNDTDEDDDFLCIYALTTPGVGTVAEFCSYILFTPCPDFCGEAEFSYTITDGNGGYSTAFVYVEVSCCEGGAPIAYDQDVTTTRGTPLPITLDGEHGDDEITFGIVEGPTHGTIKFWSDAGTLTYIPGEDFLGHDEFTFLAYWEECASDIATVEITVIPCCRPVQTDSYSI